MTISGRYRAGETEVPADSPAFLLDGEALVLFGGLEFSLKNRDNAQYDDDGFVLIDAAGGRLPAIPERMVLSGDTARFYLPDGTAVVFSTLYTGRGAELWISAVFDGGVSALEIPFRPQRSSIARDSGDGRLTVLYENTYYQFAGSGRGEEKGRLLLNGEMPFATYHALPRQKGFNPGDFSIARARTAETYNEALARWLDQGFWYWSQTAPLQNDEDAVIAYCGEAIRRGSYEAAVASVSPGFLSGDQHTYESSVYLGGMTQVLRSFTSAEQEKSRRISRLVNEKSPEILRESHVFEFLSIRGYTNDVDAGLDVIRSLDPETLTLDMVPGILEGYMDLKQWRSRSGNPFESLVDHACRLVSEGIQKDLGQDLLLVFLDGRAESEFNLRLGKALAIWAEDANKAGWAALGRSLTLSVLSLADHEGAAPPALIRSETGEIGEEAGSRISAARLYRILNPGDYYPRAAGTGSGANGVWAWTAAPVLSMVQDNETLDILVTFPVNETHYMIIRSLRPIGRIQIYDRDWPADPQFERYDSSGWVYYPATQLLVLKMKHRDTADQHIKMFYSRDENRGRERNEDTREDKNEEGTETP
jgi:hypothetical protein